MEAMVGLLGVAELRRRDGSRVSVGDGLRWEHGAATVLYFSAEWCPPCKVLTPLLRRAYDTARDGGGEEQPRAEVVYVSFDTDEADMLEYFDTHADWLALPFDAEKAQRLMTHYGLETLPALVVLAPGGEVLTTDGKSDLIEHRENALSVWQQRATAAARQ